MRLAVHQQWDTLASTLQPKPAHQQTTANYIIQQHLADDILTRAQQDNQLHIFPKPWLNAWRRDVAQRASRVDALIDALATTAAAFDQSNIPYRVLKGRPFAARYYDRPHGRRQIDLDILVQPQQINAAIQQLHNLGYTAKPRRLHQSSTGPTIRKNLLQTEHALALSQGPNHIDLHWRLRTAPAYQFNQDALWNTHQTIETDNIPYPALTDEHTLLLMLLSIASDIARGSCRIKHILDAYQILRSPHVTLDWPTFFANRKSENTLSISLNALHIVLNIFPPPPDPPNNIASLQRALKQHQPHIIHNKHDDPITLIHRPRRSIDNAMWFAKIYPIALWRDACWITRRHVTHPGRLVLASWRTARFATRATAYLIRRSFNEPPNL